MDSVAIASIRPCWCSVASVWQMPNSTANTAIASVTTSAMSPISGMRRTLVLAEDRLQRGCTA
jgi:hypothetical protein